MSSSSSEPAGLTMARMVAGWGGKVVPAFVTRAGDKIPVCGNWVLNASKDIEQIERWWKERPYCWPGIVSGVDSLIVFDCDGKSGVDWFRALCTRVGWHGGSLAYTTPGRDGGLHVVFRWPGFLGKSFRQAKVTVPGGEVQLRGNGHFTLLAGARRPDCAGRSYRILEDPGPGGPVELPEDLGRAFLRESVVSVSNAPLAASTGLGEVSPSDAWAGAPYTKDFSEPGRKNQLARLAWYLSVRGGDEGSVVAECIRFGAECCVPELSEDFCRKKAEGAVKRAGEYRAESTRRTNELFDMWRRFE